MMKKWEINGTEEIGLVSPTPHLQYQHPLNTQNNSIGYPHGKVLANYCR